MRVTWRILLVLIAATGLAVLVNSGTLYLKEAGQWGFGPAYAHICDSSGTWHYVLSGRNFVTLDSSGQQKSAIPLPGIGKQLFKVGNFVYVQSYNGLIVVDVTDPLHPVAYVNPAVGIYGMAVQQDPNGIQQNPADPRAFVAGYDYQTSSPFIGSVNMKNPTQPGFLYKLPVSGYPYSIAVDSAGHLFTGSTGGIGVYNGSNPNQLYPIAPNSLPLPSMGLSPVTGSGFLFTNTQESVVPVDYRDVNHPVTHAPLSGLYPMGTMTTGFTPDQILVPRGSGGFTVLNAGDPNQIIVGPSYQTALPANIVFAGAGGTATIASGRYGAGKYTYTGEDKIMQSWNYQTPSSTRSVIPGPGGQAWALDDVFTLWKIDMSTPANGSTAGRLVLGPGQSNTSSKHLGMTRDPAGTNLFISHPTYGTGTYVVDIVDPNMSGPLGTVRSVATPTGVVCTTSSSRPKETAQKLLYIVSGTSGLYIVDVTNPASPQKLGTYNTSGTATGLAVAGNTAYIADGSRGLVLVDVTNPASPKLLGTCDTPGNANRVAVAGTLAAVADGTAGLILIDVSDPRAPKQTSQYNPGTGTDTLDVLLLGRYAYLACSHRGLLIVNILNPANPRLVLQHGALDAVTSLTEQDGLIYLAIERAGVSVIPPMPEPNGDVNWDGITDMQDFLIMRLVATGVLTPATPLCAVPEMGDLNGNGGIDVQDCAELAAGLVENFM